MPGTEEDSTVTSESSHEETPPEDNDPTTSDNDQVIPTVTRWLDQLHLDSTMAPPPSPSVINAAAGDSSGIKINAPQEFFGARNRFEMFRMQCMLAIEMGGSKLASDRKQVLYVVSYLRGAAYDWIHPHFKDFLQNSPDQQKASTKAILKDYGTLFDAMEETFDYGDDTREAERDIRQLRQRTSAAAYKAEFQILAAKIDWNDEALASQFYRGLKERVREEITLRNERPDTLKGMFDLAVTIDTRIFELQLEKKGSYAQEGSNRKAKRNVPDWSDNYYGLQKMQIDATKGKPGSNNKGPRKGPPRPQPNKGTNDKSNVECYGCGKKGHYKRDCTVRKQRHELQGFERGKTHERHAFRTTKGPEEKIVNGQTVLEYNSLAATLPVREGRGAYDTTGTGDATPTSDDHDMMSWTACYDDECYTHMGDKQGSGWFPTRKSRSVCFSRGGPNYHLQDETMEEGSEEDASETSGSEEGEIVEGTDEESGGEEPDALVQAFPAGDITPVILRIIIRKRLEVFPYLHDGRQYVNDEKLCNLYDDIRRAVWAMTVAPGAINYSRIVQERPPIGSHFTRRGGYTTPEGIVICRSLREKVADLHKSYQEEADEQKRRPGWAGSRTQNAMIREQVEQGNIEPAPPLPELRAQPIIEEEYGDLAPWMARNRLPTPHPSPSQGRTQRRGAGN
jgi:hypothetical protein